MRGRGAHRAADVPDAVHGDLAGAARELLQDVRAGAQGERVRAADLASLERDGLLDEEAAPAVSGSRDADDAPRRSGRPGRCGRPSVAARRGRRRGASVVADCVVLAFLIQPVLLFGRPGSRTLSHRTPLAPVRWPITGKHGPSFGDRALALDPGATSRARCPVSTSPSGRARRPPAPGCARTAGSPRPEPVPPLADAARRARARRRERTRARRGARVRTPAADLRFEPMTCVLAGEAGVVDRRQGRAADARRAACRHVGLAAAVGLRSGGLLRGSSLRRGRSLPSPQPPSSAAAACFAARLLLPRALLPRPSPARGLGRGVDGCGLCCCCLRRLQLLRPQLRPPRVPRRGLACRTQVDGRVIVSWMNVTSALRARSLPWTVMLSVSVICVRARIVPTNVKPVFCRKADWTFQKTLQGWAPFVYVTLDVGGDGQVLPALRPGR